MTKKLLTDKFIQNLEYTGTRYEVWDSKQPGLKIRVGAKEGKAYYANYRIGKGRGGKLKQVKIGDFGSMSLDDVRYRVGQIVTEARYNNDLLAQEEAERAAKEAEIVAKTLAYNKHADPKDPSYLKNAWKAYVAIKKASHAEKTHQTLKARWKHFERVYGDNVKTADITLESIEKLRADLGERRSEFNHTIDALSSVLNNEVYEGRLQKNICKRVQRYPDKAREVILTEKGIQQFVTYCSDMSNFPENRHNYARFLLCMLYTGLRNSMLTSLRKRDNGVDNYLDGDVAVFRKHKTARTKNKPERVPLSAKALAVIEQAMIATPESPFVFGSHDSREFFKYQPLSMKIIETVMRSLRGRFETYGDGNFTAYSLRHTFGSMLIEKGVPVVDVSKSMLHTDIRTTMRYIKSTEEARRGTAKIIDDIF